MAWNNEDLRICGFGANLIKENQFSVFYIFRCIELRLLLCNGLIMHIHLLEVAGGC